MSIFISIGGAMVYVDAAGRQAGGEHVFTSIEMCREHYAAAALGGD